MPVTISYIKTPQFPCLLFGNTELSYLILKMDWFGSATPIPQQFKEFRTHDWEVEMNELLLVTKFLFLSDIFKKYFPNHRKTDHDFTHSVVEVKPSTPTILRQFNIKK